MGNKYFLKKKSISGISDSISPKYYLVMSVKPPSSSLSCHDNQCFLWPKYTVQGLPRASSHHTGDTQHNRGLLQQLQAHSITENLLKCAHRKRVVASWGERSPGPREPDGCVALDAAFQADF